MFDRRFSILVLIDGKKRVLLQHKEDNAPRLAGMWAFFGGGIEGKETPEEALIREAKEELDLDLEAMRFFKRYEKLYESKNYELFVFVGKLRYSLKKLKAQQREGDDLGLFSEEEIYKLNMTESDKSILKEVFSSL